MSSKVSFRARTVDSSRGLSIYRAEELPDVNILGRSVPSLPSGMEKEEEGEKHLQDILAAGTVDCGMLIPTPECTEIQVPSESLRISISANNDAKKIVESLKTDLTCDATSISNQYDKMYTQTFKQPRQYIHVQPFASNQDLPDYDMDNEDTKFFDEELLGKRKIEISHVTFEDMIDRLEKNSTINAVTLKEAKLILKEDDDLILLVYDYWLNKRLSTHQGLVPNVKTVNNSLSHNPYVCFRRRTEKMQTRKNRKNEESSYESMLKLRRDLTKVVTLLEMVKRREKTKKERLNLTLDVFDKRYALNDFDGQLFEFANAAIVRQRLNNSLNVQQWISNLTPQPRRTYKAKKKTDRQNGHRHEVFSQRHFSPINHDTASSEEEAMNTGSDEERLDANPFTFIRKEGVKYRAPLDDLDIHDDDSNNKLEKFTMSALPFAGRPRIIGYCRRRLGRGGRVVLDRLSTMHDSSWNKGRGLEDPWLCRPVTPPHVEDMDWDPYMSRNGEEVNMVADMVDNNNKVLRIVDMNKSVAHNAAGALVDSQFLDIFSTSSNIESSRK